MKLEDFLDSWMTTQPLGVPSTPTMDVSLQETTTPQPLGPTPTTDDTEHDTILQDIMYALDSWLEQISVLEGHHHQRTTMTTDSNLQEHIQSVLERLQIDGLISIFDFGGLSYIGLLWTNLIDMISHYGQTDLNTKKLIIDYSLKLHEAKQIDAELFTEIIMQL